MRFVKIVNPKEPGGYLVLAERDFRPGVHTLWSEPETGTPEHAPTGAPETADPAPPATVPPGLKNDISAYDVPIRSRTRPRGK